MVLKALTQFGGMPRPQSVGHAREQAAVEAVQPSDDYHGLAMLCVNWLLMQRRPRGSRIYLWLTCTAEEVWGPSWARQSEVPGSQDIFTSYYHGSLDRQSRRSTLQSVSQLFHGPAPHSPLHRLAVRLRHDACGKVCIMIHVPTVEPPPAEAFTFTFTFAFTEANSCTRKVATVLLDAMLLGFELPWAQRLGSQCS